MWRAARRAQALVTAATGWSLASRISVRARARCQLGVPASIVWNIATRSSASLRNGMGGAPRLTVPIVSRCLNAPILCFPLRSILGRGPIPRAREVNPLQDGLPLRHLRDEALLIVVQLGLDHDEAPALVKRFRRRGHDALPDAAQEVRLRLDGCRARGALGEVEEGADRGGGVRERHQHAAVEQPGGGAAR